MIFMTDQTNKPENKTFYIKSMKLAGYLMIQGFVLHGVKPEENSNRNLFLFTNSPQLAKAIEQYKLIKK